MAKKKPVNAQIEAYRQEREASWTEAVRIKVRMDEAIADGYEWLKNRTLELESEIKHLPPEQILFRAANYQASAEWLLLFDDLMNQARQHTQTELDLTRTSAQLHNSLKAAQKAGEAHKENRASKDDVFRWCDENHHLYPKDKDGMASAIAGKVVPHKWRTVRDWITAWSKEKKLRAAGTQDSK